MLANNLIKTLTTKFLITLALFFVLVNLTTLLSKPVLATHLANGVTNNNVEVKIHINKSSSNQWHLTYTTISKAKKIAFIRNPDNSRTKRWTPLNTNFEIIYVDKQEYIQRKDLNPFSRVTLALTPTYQHLTKDYAPFSPFSDGSSLIYSGRLFACINFCNEKKLQWPISVKAPQNQFIVVNGKVHSGSTNWIGINDGQNIYIGSKQPVESASFVAVIDDALPDQIKRNLQTQIPAMMTFFAKRLGNRTGPKPTLFASYSNKPGGSSQGGTLPNQIFMHWDMDNLTQKLQNAGFVNSTLWFFAHEVAHFYQRSESQALYQSSAESWLHEGHADWLAALFILDQVPQLKHYVDKKITVFEEQCVTGLQSIALNEAAANGKFRLYYSCGLLLHKALDQAVRKNSHGLHNSYTIWQQFRSSVESGEKPGADTFWMIANKHVSNDLHKQLQRLTNEKLTQPQKLLNQILN